MKCVLVLVGIAFCCISLNLASEVPNIGSEIAGAAVNRTKRGCVDWQGCYNGYCWAGCGISGMWCYTAPDGNQAYHYHACSSDSDCSGCWGCDGPCTHTNFFNPKPIND